MLVARALKNQLIRRLPIGVDLRISEVGFLPRRGRRTQPGVLTPGKIQSNARPHKALHRSAHLEKHPRQRVVGAERALDVRVGYRLYYEPRSFVIAR
jgi:hypothetical protein